MPYCFHPGHWAHASPRRTIRGAVSFLHRAQHSNGAWFGSWGICFTYATQFALESLSLVGETYETSEYARRACEFLIGKQRADGGWGESYKVRFAALPLIMVGGWMIVLWPVMRDQPVGRARGDAGRADELGGDGAHVRQVPVSGAH